MIVIKKLGLRCWPSACAESHNFQNADMTSPGNRQHVAGLDLATGSRHLLFVHTHIASRDKFGRQASGLGDSGKPEPLVYAQFGTFFAHHSPNKKAHRKAAL